MKRLLFLLLLCASSAGAVTLDLASVSVPDLSRVVFKEMLKADYVLSPDVLASDARLSLSIVNKSNDKVLDAVREVFTAAGFTMEKRGGVYFIDTEAEEEAEKITEEFYTYKAKARPIAYLTKLAKFAGAKVVEGDMSGDVLVYSASADVKMRLAAVLAAVDTPAPAITIRAALIEYSDTSDTGQSLGLSVLSHHVKAIYAAGPVLGNSFTITGGALSGVLSAIAGDTRFSYLSQPMLRVLDGEAARLSVGAEVPTRGAVTLDKNGNAIQSVQYQSSGVILSVTPHIVGDLINLKVDQQISSFTTTTTSNIDSPSLLKRQATTTIDIHKGQLVVLAGLDEDKDTNSRSGLNFVPSWGWSKSNSKSKSQILLLIEVPEDQAI